MNCFRDPADVPPTDDPWNVHKLILTVNISEKERRFLSNSLNYEYVFDNEIFL